MKCPNCSAELNENAKFCPNCGTPVGSVQTNNSGTDQNKYPSDNDNGSIFRDSYDSYPAQKSRSSYGKKHSRKPRKKSRKKPLIISIVALVLVAAIVTSVILVINRNTVSAKELEKAKENYLPPAQAVTIDTSLTDPSNDKIQFKYDDRARIISCTYKVNDKTYDQRYTYDDTKRMIDVETSYRKRPIFTKNIEYDRVNRPNTFEDIDGYYIRLDDSVVSSAAEEPQETAAPTEEPTEAPTEEPTEEPTEATSDWKDLYIDFLNTTDVWDGYFDAQSGDLFYIDDNDIPELIFLSGGGNHQQEYEFCWIENGSVQHESFYGGGMNYQKRGGKIYSAVNGNFNSGWNLFEFDGTSFYKSHYGTRLADDPGNPVFEHTVDGEAVSEEEYRSSYSEYADWDRLNDLRTWTKRASLPDYIRNY